MASPMRDSMKVMEAKVVTNQHQAVFATEDQPSATPVPSATAYPAVTEQPFTPMAAVPVHHQVMVGQHPEQRVCNMNRNQVKRVAIALAFIEVILWTLGFYFGGAIIAALILLIAVAISCAWLCGLVPVDENGHSLPACCGCTHVEHKSMATTGCIVCCTLIIPVAFWPPAFIALMFCFVVALVGYTGKVLTEKRTVVRPSLAVVHRSPELEP